MAAKIPAEFIGLEKSAQKAAKAAGRNLKINLGTSARSVESLSQPLGRITGKADEFTKSMEAANARVLAFGASVGVLRAVTSSFKELVVTTIQVEKQMASINAILGASSGEISKFKKEIFEVARNTEQSFDTVATAALELSRQGLGAIEVVKRLNDSMVLSRLSGQSAADAVAGLTSAVNGFKKAGITSAQVVNKFSEAAKSAAVSERDLADAFKRAGAVAGQAGVSFDELVGIVSAVQEKTSRGGAVIGNSFKTIFTRIQSLEKLKTMQELGVQVTNASGDILGATELIQNLAGVLENFPDARRLQIAEGLVGKFQVAPFISILEDYNDETSKAIKITEISSRATTAAYQRNEALNKTLSAAINEVTVNLSQLGDMLGSIGVTDSLQNVLGFFNSMVEGLKGLLDEETGSSIAKGLVKGIGSVISGPGLAIFAAVIGKLTLDLVKFGTGSLKTFFGMNNAAKQQATLQGQIASTLLGNKGIQDAILKIERSSLSAEQKKVQQTKFFTTALNEQLRVMQKMQGIATRVAPGVMAGTRRGRGAGGYIPNFAGGSVVGSEQADINRGVGGAPPSARPVSIPNFNFGGGQRGTMVANNSEFIVPNFAGGSAIFNQNMASSMGLPAGARPVGAAGGYIPNFAKVFSVSGHMDKLKGQNSEVINKAANYQGRDQNKLNKAAAAQSIQKSKKSRKTFDADKKGYALLTMRRQGTGRFTHNFKEPFMGFNSFKGTSFGIKTDNSEMGQYGKMTQLEKKLDDSLAAAANKVVTAVHPLMTEPRPKITAGNLDRLIADEGGAGALEAVKGALFESITNAVIDGVKNDSRGNLDIAFNSRNRGPLNAIFGVGKSYRYGDYKASMSGKDKFVRQAINHSGGKAAGGYIPNFVGNLENAIGREAAAGVPINQIRVNQKGALRNAGNPMGLAVTNTRDEPTGAIPNFANELTQKSVFGGNVSKFAVMERGFTKLGPVLDKLNNKIKQLEESISKGSMSHKKAGKVLDKYTQTITKNTNISAADSSKLASASKQQLSGTKKAERGQRDMLGTVFAVQMGLSALAGATSDAEKGFGRFANRLTSALSTVTTAALAGSALGQFGDSFKDTKPALGKFLKGLGGVSIAFGAVVGGVKFFKNIMNDASGETDAAAKNMAFLADAANTAGRALNELGEVGKLLAKDEAEEILGKSGLNFTNEEEQKPLMITAISRAVAAGVGPKGILDIIGTGKPGVARREHSSLELREMVEELSHQSTLSSKSVDTLFENFFKNPEALKQIQSSDFKDRMKELRDVKGPVDLRAISAMQQSSAGFTAGDSPVSKLQADLLNKFDHTPNTTAEESQSAFVFNLIRRRVEQFSGGGGLAAASEAGNRIQVDKAKQLITEQINNLKIQQAGISPIEEAAARAGKGMLMAEPAMRAKIGSANLQMQEKALIGFLEMILEAIDMTKDLDVDSKGFKNAMEFLKIYKI
jgi:TP901 family phage tail tape measure protein